MKPYVVKEVSAPIRRRISNEKVETAIAIVEASHKLYQFTRTWYIRKFSFTVTVSEADSIYQDVHDWLISVLPHEKHKSLSVASKRKMNRYGDTEAVSPDSEYSVDKAEPLTIRFNDSAARQVVIDGHTVTVTLNTPDAADKADKYIERYEMHKEIVFTTFSYAGQQMVIRQLEKLNQQRATTRKAVLKMMNQWGSWRTRSDLPPRTMDSVNLPKSQKERIVADLGGFLEAEERYNRLAIPWHRGYMLHGPPGTGKTSLVKALANEFNLDLWYISLSDLKAETSLLGLLSEVGPRSLLLLEDIDTIKITHDRDSSDPGSISMGSLLNTLDGVATPHGLVTVMTTNRFDILDPALTRAGRMDLIEELGYPDLFTVSEMYQHFFGIEPKWGRGILVSDPQTKEISASQIAEVMKRHLDDPKTALDAVKKLIKEK